MRPAVIRHGRKDFGGYDTSDGLIKANLRFTGINLRGQSYGAAYQRDQNAANFSVWGSIPVYFVSSIQQPCDFLGIYTTIEV